MTTALRPELPPLPERMKRLPVDKRGYPVPWFVEKVDGEWDFRVVQVPKMIEAYTKRKCWVCGGDIGSSRVGFTIGPMCAVNRTNGEPPSHVDCADFSARACPFLARPHMKRRDNNLPVEAVFHEAAIERNPQVALVWITKRSSMFSHDGRTPLFKLGEPESVRWYHEGRIATRREVLDALDSGLPLLQQMAEEDGADAVEEIARATAVAMKLVPTGCEDHAPNYHRTQTEADQCAAETYGEAGWDQLDASR